MKNNNPLLALVVLLFLLPCFTQGQSLSAKTFFSDETVPAVYLGIDFTLAKLINDEASNATVVQSQQFNGINELIIKENKKYDVQDAYHRKNWTMDLKEVMDRNQKADPAKLMSSNDGDLTRLGAGDIDKIVHNYNYGNNKGYGVLLIMEGMDKTKKMATIWFTLIDMNAKKVLTTARVEGKLGAGFGFRNFWASAIKNAIGQAKKDYKQWQSGASSK